MRLFRTIIAASFMAAALVWQSSAFAVAPNAFFRAQMQRFFSEDENQTPPFQVRSDVGAIREELRNSLGLRVSEKRRLPFEQHFFGVSEAGETCHAHIKIGLEYIRVSIANNYSGNALEFTHMLNRTTDGELTNDEVAYGTEGRGFLRWQKHVLGTRMTWFEGKFPDYLKIDHLAFENGERRALNLYCGKLKAYRNLFDRLMPAVKAPDNFGGGRDPFPAPNR